MFGWRSARGRAVLASVVLILVLVTVASVAILRVRQHQDRLLALEDTAATAIALEHARAQFFLEAAAASALMFIQDPTLAEEYHLAAAELRQDLSQARAEMIASGKADDLAALDTLTERIGAIEAEIEAAMPFFLTGDQEAILALASTRYPELWPTIVATMDGLDALAEAQESEMAARRATASHAADVTSWIVVGAGGIALLLATGVVIVIIASVVRPLASLRASARAITSGDLESRAKVAGPEEVASLARDFNEMTDALWAKTKEYIDTTNLTGDMIAKLDKHGNWTFLNDSACQFLGRPREELLGTDSRALLHPEDLERTAQAIRETRATKELVRGFVNRMISPMGTRVLEWNGYPLFDEEGQYVGIQMTARDITERKQMEQAVRESEEQYRTIFEQAADSIVLVDAETGALVQFNDRAHQALGYTREEFGKLKISDFEVIESPEEVARHTERIVREGTDTFETKHRTKSGQIRDIEVRTRALSIPGRHLVQSIWRDITDRKRAEGERERLHAELELRAITDSLTDLYDHAHFYQRLAEEIERSKRYNHGFVVVMLDIDDFKRFNDSRGHQAGDEMLRLIAHCIQTGLRRSDIAFRYGGDEFAAILPHADSPKARAVVNRINGRITKSIKHMDKGAAHRLSLSAGVACFPDDGTTADELVRLADAALYNAKWVARARDIMGQREDIESLISALVSRRGGVEGPPGGVIFRPEALHEQQARIVSSVASSIAVALKDAGVAQALEDPDLQVLATVGAAAEIKDRYIRGHPERTSEQGAALAQEMGLSPQRVRDIRIAALLHDIGKVTVSEGILNKPGRLTRREFAAIKDHPIVGATLVSQVRGFERLVPIVRHHHERFDGEGYPDGLAGEEIPPEARILSVVDVFDALTHQRSYRKALSRQEAIAEIERGAGTQFDPLVVKAFPALVRRRGGRLAAPAQAASAERQPVAARAAGRQKR